MTQENTTISERTEVVVRRLHQRLKNGGFSNASVGEDTYAINVSPDNVIHITFNSEDDDVSAMFFIFLTFNLSPFGFAFDIDADGLTIDMKDDANANVNL